MTSRTAHWVRPMDPSSQQTLERLAWSPALLLDVTAQSAAALALLASDGLSAETRALLSLRVAELVRRTAPAAALERLSTLLDVSLLAAQTPVAHAVEARRIAAHAALSLARFDEARCHAALCGAGPGGELVRARLDALTDRDAALARLDAMLHSNDAPGVEDHPECLAEALYLRARWRAESGRLAEASADLAALTALATRHGAELTATFTRLGERICRELAAHGLAPQGLPQTFATLVEQTLVAGLDPETLTPEQLGPIPPWLHGAMTQALTASCPELVGRAALAMALLFEAAHRFDDARAALVYGQGLARRLGDENGASELEQQHRRLQERLAHHT